ncbi:cystine/glutamate transporter-like [Diadema antillarum]|uniref:cystine/glutamate transporter-like n=1 Tax=Diadema antillarum TaxID=105358 RepID=UPI003A8BA28D
MPQHSLSRSSLSSSFRRCRNNNATTSTIDIDLVGNEYVENQTDDVDVSRESPLSSNSARAGLTIQRHFGSLHCVCVVLGVCVSFGSLFSVRQILVHSGGLVPALLVWLSAGAMMFVGAQCYAELATSVPKTGGDFIFLFHALPVKMPAFMQVWMGLVMGSGTAISVLGKLAAVHLLALVCNRCGDDTDHTATEIKLIAGLLICVLMAVHCRSTLLAAWLQVILTFVKLASFLAIIVLGFVDLASGRLSNLQYNAWHPPSNGQPNVMIAFAVASMSYSGWQSLAFITEEIKSPEKTIQHTMSFSLIAAIVLCILLNVAYGTLLTPDELLSKQPVIMVIGQKVLGRWSYLVHLPILICALSDMNVLILSVSRMFFSAGREGQSPSLWSMVHLRYLTPLPAIIVMLPIALLLLCVDVQLFLATLGPFQWLTGGIVVVMVLVYRVKYPDLTRPFKVPFVFPVIFVAYCVFLTGLAVYNNPRVLGIILALIVPAFPLQIFLIRLGRPRAFLRLVGRCNHFLQKLLLVAKPDRVDTFEL